MRAHHLVLFLIAALIFVLICNHISDKGDD